MKKAVLILAGIMLLSGYAFAEEDNDEKAMKMLGDVHKKLSSSKWNFKGTNVEHTLTLFDSQKETIKNGYDSDLILKISTKLDDKTSIYFKYDTDDSNPDTKVEFVAHRKFNEYLEAQVDLDILVENGISMKEDNDSDKVWIKYHPNENYTIKLAPYSIGMCVGDEFETTDEQDTPGIQLDMKLTDDLLGIIGVGNNPSGEENNIGYKFGMEYSNDKTSLTAMVTGTTQKEDSDAKGIYDMSANVSGKVKIANLTLKAEAAFQDLNQQVFGADETDTAFFVNASYDMGKIMGETSLAPYVSYYMVGEYAYFDEDDYSATIGGSKVAGHGGLNVIELGTKVKLKGGLTVQPYFEMMTADNEIFEDKDGKAEDTKSQFVVKTKLSF